MVVSRRGDNTTERPKLLCNGRVNMVGRDARGSTFMVEPPIVDRRDGATLVAERGRVPSPRVVRVG